MKGIADLLDSDMEDIENNIDENSTLSLASDDSTVAPSRQKNARSTKPRKRRPVTMVKSKSRVTKPQAEGATKKPTKAMAGAKRKALEEQVNVQTAAAEAIENESEDELESPQTIKPVKREPAAKGKGKKPQKVDDNEDMEVEQTPIVARSSHAQSKAAKSAAKFVTKKAAVPKARPNKRIPETQIEQQMETETDGGETTEAVQRLQQGSRIRDESRKPQEAFRRRAGSASDTERGDPNLRRKLGDITRKFENIDLKYRNLKEVGINEANANVEKLRKQCETTTQASSDLIASLKKELASQAPLAQDSRKLKKDMQAKETELAQLRTKVSNLTTFLSDAQNEIKTLQAKLSASRSAPTAEPATSKPPGSASRNNITRNVVMAGSGEIVQTAQAAQMKEDLYSDLTGLIIRSAKKTPEGDAFDCIQTGRNGTLHFKLFIDQEEVKSTSFEETEFLYTPLLDANRDRDMIEMMPDYLRDDITFARQNAAKFYSRVVDTLTKRRAEEE